MKHPHVTEKEINRLVDLRKRVPEKTASGMDNRSAIDAQLRVLRKELFTMRQIEDAYLNRRIKLAMLEPLCYDYELAMSAYRWLYDVEDTAPSSWWLEVIQHGGVQE